MRSPAPLNIPKSRSLRAWTALAVVVISGSYVLTILLGVLCVLVPLVLLGGGQNLVWGVLLLLFGVLVDIVILQALFRRRERFKAPGVLIDLCQHPRMAAEIESIASALGQPMPREVYILAVPNAFASERTDLPRGGNRRVLGLGLPLLATMTVSEFRSIVAHEFAHFYSADTRLGPWVYSSRATMVHVLNNFHSGSAGQLIRFLGRIGIIAIAQTVVIGGIVQYWKLLLRVTTLLSRRQEFRSDELACRIGGTAAFTDALRRVHIAGATFVPFWNTAVGPVLNLGFCPPLVDGFARYLANPIVKQSAAKSVDAQLANKAFNPLDTHPALADRISRASTIPELEGSRNDQLAASLLDDIDSIEAQLVVFLLPALQKVTLRKMNWDTVAATVYLPSWKNSLKPYLQYLGDRSIGQLPRVIEELKKSPISLPDPPGMLLTREQRDERVSSVFWMAMTLSMVQAGWNLHIEPARSWIGLGSDRIEPVSMIRGLRQGRTSEEQWIRYCEKLGIAALPLNPQVSAANA